MAVLPATLLERIVSQRVELQLKDGRRLAGRLQGIDEHLNLVLDETEETTPTMTRRLGRVVLRGSNVVTLNSVEGSPTVRAT